MTGRAKERAPAVAAPGRTGRSPVSSKILIVENEMIIALGIKNILTDRGYDVVGLEKSGQGCLARLDRELPDVILMDIKIDGPIDGIETAREIREKYDVPVIFITAHSDESNLERLIPTEHYGYILKPVNEKELFTTIQTTLYRHEIDNRIKKSEMKFRVLFEQSRDAIYICGMDRKFTEVNLSLLNLFGYGRDELRGMEFPDLFGARGDAENIFFIIDEYGFIDNYPAVMKRKDGGERLCLINSALIRDDYGYPTGIQGIIRDITEQKRMEREREYLVNNLAKRVKELRCLYILSEIIDKPGVVFSDILSGMVEVLKESWQYPEITCVRIRHHDREFATHGFRESPWGQSVDIMVNREKAGGIEVYYLEKRPEMHEGPFLREERNLLAVISERLGGIAERFMADEDLKRSRDELRNLTKHLQTVREDERTRISREIHDELGQAMTAIKMDVAWIQENLDPGRGDIQEKLKQITQIIDSTIQTVRRISTDLRPGILDDLGLSAAIEWQIREVAGRTGIFFATRIDDFDESMNNDYKVMFFRIFQEAITNVVRHSKATEVRVSLARAKGAIELEIRDNGIGITEEQITFSNSCGIIGMRERANSCGGTISISGKRGAGTAVTVSLPL